MNVFWALCGIIGLIVAALFVYSLCRAASQADEAMEKMKEENKQ